MKTLLYIDCEPEMVNYIFTVVAELEINHHVCSLEGDLFTSLPWEVLSLAVLLDRVGVDMCMHAVLQYIKLCLHAPFNLKFKLVIKHD